ncbi:MAG: hypothetical protein M1591_01870 [Deltaproteobacteria bacterium]|nr:hypothetical protein [Deltaproteobacteria bacterium]
MEGRESYDWFVSFKIEKFMLLSKTIIEKVKHKEAGALEINCMSHLAVDMQIE